MGEYLWSALVFGLSAGFKPGPLWLLIVQQTLEHGIRQGLRAALAPLISDGPIILASLIALHQVDDFAPLITVLSLIGGGYLLWLANKTVHVRRPALAAATPNAPKSLTLAIKVNLLNPNPYLFWFSVGGSYFATGTAGEIALFIGVFTGSLLISSLAVAWITARFRAWFDSALYRWVMRILGLLLAVFGCLFIVQGLASY